MSLHEMVQLKTAVYIQKLRDDGSEISAKDLSDVVELMRANAADRPERQGLPYFVMRSGGWKPGAV